MNGRARQWIGLLSAAGLVSGAAAVLSMPAAYAEVTCHGKKVTEVITADTDDQVHSGTKGDDVVLLKGSAWQTFHAKGGNDTVCVQGYGSEVYGGSGNDWISGEKADGIYAHGSTGNDTIIGSADDDQLYGGPGNDLLRGRAGNDRLDPDQDDLVEDAKRRDGADEVQGGAGSDQITVLAAKSSRTDGADRLDGGSGYDSLEIHGVAIKINLGKGSMRAEAGGPTDHFGAIEQHRTDDTADITGTSGSDDVSLLGKNSRLDAGGGTDEIYVDAKRSVINAGSGNDVIYYDTKKTANRIALGSGDDKITVLNANGVQVSGGPGDDSFDLRTHGDDGEDEGAIYGTQTALFKGQRDNDTITWDCEADIDVNEKLLTCTHRKAKIEFSGLQTYRAVEGWNWDDTFRGSPHRDIFYGGEGRDLMYGRKGADKLIGGKGRDIAHGGPGQDECEAERQFRC
jgi:Ca2+-binding RTX toxin-like protein